MKKIVRDIFIKAPREKVWENMLSDEGYRSWASAFHEGARADSDWNEGSKIKFVDDTDSGMLAVIKEKKPYEKITFEMKGMVQKGEEDTESEWAKMYAGMMETYTFTEQDGGTLLHIEAGADDSMLEEMEEGWDKALAKLKEMVEST